MILSHPFKHSPVELGHRAIWDVLSPQDKTKDQIEQSEDEQQLRHKEHAAHQLHPHEAPARQ